MNETELLEHVVSAVVDLKEYHKETWRDKPEDYWLARLMQEVGELSGTLVGSHDDSTEWELVQIAAICLNWLEMRINAKGSIDLGKLNE